MRKLSILLCAALAACACLAAPKTAIFTLTPGTNATDSAGTTAISGYIDEIVLEFPSGVIGTGAVAVTATPIIGSAATLASATISATKLTRPRVDGTDTGGNALTNDPPGRYMSAGDKITAALSSAAPTGQVWRVLIKYDDSK